MEICVLGSGSKGNAIWVATQRAAVLVDAGFGKRSLARRMAQAGLGGRSFDAVLLSHGHSDHVGGLRSLLSQKPTPVHMSEGTRKDVPGLDGLDSAEQFAPGKSFTLGDLEITPFSVSHDATEPCCFRFASQGIQGAVVTDLGELDASVVAQLESCDWIVLESNHDEEMLKIGPYPWSVKQRVMSRVGHLSNQATSHFLARDFDGQARHIFLAHLSQANNDPEIALDSARRALAKRPFRSGEALQLHVARQDQPTRPVCL